MFINKGSPYFTEYETISKTYEDAISKRDKVLADNSDSIDVDILCAQIDRVNAAHSKASWAIAEIVHHHFDDLIDKKKSNPALVQSFSKTVIQINELAESPAREEKVKELRDLVAKHLLKKA